jgi:hypothetical protein
MAYRTINPFTEEVVKEYPPHTPEQVEQALWESDILPTSSGGIAKPRMPDKQ